MRDHNYFEDWARHMKMIPQYAVETEQGKVLLADSESAFFEGEKRIYRTGYAIERGKMEIGAYADYDSMEFIAYTPEGAKEKRLLEALTAARVILQQTTDAGLYDDDRKNSFSVRPDQGL